MKIGQISSPILALVIVLKIQGTAFVKRESWDDFRILQNNALLKYSDLVIPLEDSELIIKCDDDSIVRVPNEIISSVNSLCAPRRPMGVR